MADHIPDFDDMFPGYFNAGHFEDGERTVTLRTIVREELAVIGKSGKPTGDTQDKWVMVFADSPNRMVLNETNASLIRAMFGRKTSAWIGKRITLHSEPNCGFGKPGVRVCGSPDIDSDVSARPGLMPKPSRVYTLRRTQPPAAEPKPAQVDPSAALSSFHAGAKGQHGLDPQTIDAWLKSIGQKPASKQSVADLRAIFADLGKCKAWAAEQGNDSADDGGEYVE